MFKFIEPSATLITEKDPLKLIESVGRTCYKSEGRITEDSAREFVPAYGHGRALQYLVRHHRSLRR